jgi:DNA invertase Pin-like site-specific DNA recombinase
MGGPPLEIVAYSSGPFFPFRLKQDKRIIEETASGGKVQRSGLERVQEMLRQGDVLAVWRLDRLGRSLKHLIEVMGGLEDQGIGFHSVTESIDTTTPGGKLVFHIFGALAEFERNLDPRADVCRAGGGQGEGQGRRQAARAR